MQWWQAGTTIHTLTKHCDPLTVAKAVGVGQQEVRRVRRVIDVDEKGGGRAGKREECNGQEGRKGSMRRDKDGKVKGRGRKKRKRQCARISLQ